MIDTLIDTNVLIYSLNQDSKYHEASKRIILNTEMRHFITTKNISEFVAAATRFNLMPYYEILEAVHAFKNSFHLLYPNAKSMKIFLKLITNYHPHKNHVFDMEIISIMLANGLNRIATFNEKDFQDIEDVTVVN
jgi:predicted nucleic acid-binding protein